MKKALLLLLVVALALALLPLLGWLLFELQPVGDSLADKVKALKKRPGLQYSRIHLEPFAGGFRLTDFVWKKAEGVRLAAAAAHFSEPARRGSSWDMNRARIPGAALSVDLGALLAKESKKKSDGNGGGPRFEHVELPGASLELLFPGGTMRAALELSVDLSGERVDLQSGRLTWPEGRLACAGWMQRPDGADGLELSCSMTGVLPAEAAALLAGRCRFCKAADLRVSKFDIRRGREGLRVEVVGLGAGGFSAGPASGGGLEISATLNGREADLAVGFSTLSFGGTELLTAGSLKTHLQLPRHTLPLRLDEVDLRAAGVSLTARQLVVEKGLFGVPKWRSSVELGRLELEGTDPGGPPAILSGRLEVSGSLAAPTVVQLASCSLTITDSEGPLEYACGGRPVVVDVLKPAAMVQRGQSWFLEIGDAALGPWTQGAAK